MSLADDELDHYTVVKSTDGKWWIVSCGHCATQVRRKTSLEAVDFISNHLMSKHSIDVTLRFLM